MRDHTKLRAFELAKDLAIAVYKATADFPTNESFGLTSQLRRAAVSVASNIVEGCARHSMADYVRFLDIAYGSSRELQFQIELAHQLNFLPTSQFEDLHRHATESAKVLNGLLRSLRRDQQA